MSSSDPHMKKAEQVPYLSVSPVCLQKSLNWAPHCRALQQMTQPLRWQQSWKLQWQLGRRAWSTHHLSGRKPQSGYTLTRTSRRWISSEAMENHSKRNNVRLVGLKETFGTNGTLLSWVQKILAQGLGVQADAVEFEFVIERVHQPLTPMLDPEQPPRVVFILRQSAKDKMASYGKDVGCLDSPIWQTGKWRRENPSPQLNTNCRRWRSTHWSTLQFKWQETNHSNSAE